MAKQKWWQRENKKKQKKNKGQKKQQKLSKSQQRQANYTKPKGKNMTEDLHNKPINELTDAEFDSLVKAHDTGGAFKSVATARQNCWDAGIEILPNCGKVTVPQYHIAFDLLAHQKINKLKAYYPRLEWLAYLVGSVDHETNKVVVEDLIIPDSQQVTGASVYNVEYEWGVLPDGKQIIGVIHSHHTMGAFFSGTDDAYINQNHDVSIVVATAKGREIKSQIRVKVPCGSYVLAEDITYSVNYPDVLVEEDFEAEFKDKINTYTPVVTYINYGTNYLGNYSGGYSGHRGISGQTNRFAGNPPRNGQMDLYDSSIWDDLDEEYDNPFLMSSIELRDALLDYYSEADVDEFMNDGFQVAANELKIVQDLCAEGITVGRSSAITEDYQWVDGDGNAVDDVIILDPNEEIDPLDTNAQNGQSQVARGVALRDQDNEQGVWELEDGETEIEFNDNIKDTALYQRLNRQLQAEGLFDGMEDVQRDKIIREAIQETEDLTANG